MFSPFTALIIFLGSFIAKSKLKNKEISEDEEKAEEDRIQKETDKYVAKIEEICDKKEKEIMSV